MFSLLEILIGICMIQYLGQNRSNTGVIKTGIWASGYCPHATRLLLIFQLEKSYWLHVNVASESNASIAVRCTSRHRHMTSPLSDPLHCRNNPTVLMASPRVTEVSLSTNGPSHAHVRRIWAATRKLKCLVFEGRCSVRGLARSKMALHGGSE